MEKEICVDNRLQPEFSRFETNLANGSSLPIFPITFPVDGKMGVMLVGDYIAQDLIMHLNRVNVSDREKWLILSTTQSDAVPVDCSDVDYNFFTNEKGIDKYLASHAGKIPFSTELGDGHYIDSDIFYPNPEVPKKWDIVYPAKWYPTKRTELLLEAAKLDPSLKIAIYGWPVVSERKIEQSILYRDLIIKMAKDIPNVEVFDAGFKTGEVSHFNSDGTVVIGNLSKEEMRDKFYWPAKTSIFLSETTEAINRVCTEMLCCDVPMLVAPTNGGMERLVSDETGVLISRSPEGILKGIHYALEHQNKFVPRESYLKSFGKEKANKRLREIVASIAEKKGVEINWVGAKEYGGDLWTSSDVYNKIIKSKK
jgi:glycosyltransferase involved in cell wall biosynthesis